MTQKTRQFSALIENEVYNKLKTISNNTSFYSIQSVLNAVLKSSLNTNEGIALIIEADNGESYTLQDWIEKGKEEVTLDEFGPYTKNLRSISKQFKESFNTLSIKEKNNLKDFLESILEYIKRKNFTPEIGTNINASIHAFSNEHEDSYTGSHVLYIKIENAKIYIGRLMHFNRQSLQLSSQEYPVYTDFVWKEVMNCINSNTQHFQEYIENEAYIVDTDSLEVLLNHFNNL